MPTDDERGAATPTGSMLTLAPQFETPPAHCVARAATSPDAAVCGEEIYERSILDGCDVFLLVSVD